MIRPLVRVSVLVAVGSLSMAASVTVSAQAVQFAAHRDYSAGYGPASIAVGDLNGDQLPDLASANHLDNTAAVLLGNGDGTFQPPRSVYLGPNHSPRSIAIGDLNHDGRPDLVLASPASNAMTILAGNGDATFQPAVNLTVGNGPSSVVVNDFNGDGRLDLAIANAGGSTVSLLAGNGDGTFQTAQNFAAGDWPSFLALGDFNKDQRADLAVASSGSGTLSILLGNGDGTFQAPRTLAPGTAPSAWSVAVGDFNGDGAQDLVATNPGANTVSVFRGNGDGTFQPSQSFASGSGPTSVVTSDVDGDGHLDVVVANERDGTPEGASCISVLLGNGDGSFDAPATFAVGSVSWSIAAGNFNGDGAPDLAVANTYSTTISVLLGHGDGTFPAPLTVRVGRNPEGLAAGDLNGDGITDLAVSNAGSNTVSIMLGNGNGSFQPTITFAAGQVPVFIAVGDFNRDGTRDLVVANYGSSHYYSDVVASTVSVLLGNGDGTFQTGQTFEAGSGPHGITVQDFNGDGAEDLAVANLGPYPQRATTVSVLLGQGDGTFTAPQAYHAGHGLTGVATGDFNRDGRPDLALSSGDDATVSVLLGNGDGTFLTATHFGVGSSPKSVTVADVNADQVPDLVVTDHFSDTVSVLLGNGDGTFQDRLAFDTGRNPAWVSVGDLNGDGNQDLAVGDWFATTVTVLVGNGDGTFQPGQGFGAGAAPEKVVLADFNGDGQLDMAVANYFSASVSVLMNRTNTQRVAAPSFTPAGGTYVGPQAVTINVATGGATIYFTTDGSTPTTSSSVYMGPFLVDHTMTVRAVAVAIGMGNSDVASATYTIRALSPALSPPAGTYDQPQSVEIRSDTAAATIYYTLDGSMPTTASPVYSVPIPVTESTRIRAIAVASGMADSMEVSGDYTLHAATPSFNVPEGSYLLPQFVEISSASPGVAIYYTTDGSAPTTASARYSGPILVAMTTTIRAMAVAPGWTPSLVASARYQIVVE